MPNYNPVSLSNEIPTKELMKQIENKRREMNKCEFSESNLNRDGKGKNHF